MTRARIASLVLTAALTSACGGEEPRFRPSTTEVSTERVEDTPRAADPHGHGATSGHGSTHDTPVVRVEPAEARPDSIPAPEDVAAPPASAERSSTGLAWRVLRPGTGTTHPQATSQFEVHYTGWTTDGRMFDSSVTRGETATFPLNRVIAGWTEGVQLMVGGEQRRFWIPQDLAYQGRPGPPAGMLVFDVELIRIVQ